MGTGSRALLALGLLSLAACGSGSAASSPSDYTTFPADSSTPAVAPPVDVPTAVPVVAPTPPPWQGYGAKVADWNAAHTPSPSCVPGACYNPDVALPQVNGNVGSEYVTVSATDGRILMYTMNLVHGTSQAAATLAALRQFPPDVRTIWTARRDACVQMEVASATLAATMADPGNPQGYVFFELQSDPDAQGNYTTYSAANVTGISFQPGPLFTSAATAGVPC